MKPKGIGFYTLSFLHIMGLFLLAFIAQLILWPPSWQSYMPAPQIYLIFFIYFCLYSSFAFSVLIIYALSLLMGSISSISVSVFFAAFTCFYFFLLMGKGLFYWRKLNFLLLATFFASLVFPFFLQIFSNMKLSLSVFSSPFTGFANGILTAAIAWGLHFFLQDYIKPRLPL